MRWMIGIGSGSGVIAYLCECLCVEVLDSIISTAELGAGEQIVILGNAQKIQLDFEWDLPRNFDFSLLFHGIFICRERSKARWYHWMFAAGITAVAGDDFQFSPIEFQSSCKSQTKLLPDPGQFKWRSIYYIYRWVPISRRR